MHPEHIEADARAWAEDSLDIAKAIGIIAEGTINSVYLDKAKDMHIEASVLVKKPVGHIKLTFIT